MSIDQIRLAYVSTLRPSATSADIDDLVAKAAIFNKDHDITGVLAIDKNRVCQILEGPAHAVESLFVSIKQDPRHHHIIEIEHRTIDSTSFESWGMARRDMIDIVMFALTN